MPFKRYVQTGRVAYISGGRYGGKLCSIVDVIDQTRALVDGPVTGVPRVAVRLNQLRLTKFLHRFPFKGPTKCVRKAWVDNKILDKWNESQWAKNLEARRLRKRLTDFDRFKLRFARKIRNSHRTREFKKLLRTDKKRRSKKIKERKERLLKKKEKIEKAKKKADAQKAKDKKPAKGKEAKPAKPAAKPAAKPEAKAKEAKPAKAEPKK